MHVILQVVATSTDDATFSGSFDLQLLSKVFKCTFSLTKGKGPEFDDKPSKDGGFKLKHGPPTTSGSTATLEGTITM